MMPTRRAVLTGASTVVALAAATPPAEARWEPIGELSRSRHRDPRSRASPDTASSTPRRAARAPAAAGARARCGSATARYLLWSDIPNNRILRWDEETGAVSVFRKPSNNANGNTRDRQGRLVTCEHDARRVTRTEYDGSITVLLDQFDGKPLNSPNDVVVKSDGSIWFTDPPFGILGYYEGTRRRRELAPQRLPARSRDRQGDGRGRRHHGPNGLCFSPDERRSISSTPARRRTRSSASTT